MSFLSLHGRVFTIILCSLYRARRSSAPMRTNTHADTCAHTQVSTLPSADRIGLKNQCTAMDTFKNTLHLEKGLRMRPNENGYTRRGNRMYTHVRSENSEIDLASIFWIIFRELRVALFKYSLVINLWNENNLFCCE